MHISEKHFLNLRNSKHLQNPSKNERRGRDSNPRYGLIPVRRFSKPLPSATRPPLRVILFQSTFCGPALQEDYQLPITSYQLPVTNYQLPITNYQLPVTSYQLPTTSYQLPVTNYQLPTTSYGGSKYRPCTVFQYPLLQSLQRFVLVLITPVLAAQ